MPGICSQAWSVSLGLCRATGRHGNGGNRPALATDPGNGSDPRQLFVASPPVLLSAPPPLLRYGGVCLALWSLHNIHWRSWERCLKVPFEASGGWGESGVQMDQALSFPPSPPTTSGLTREAPFWLLHETLNEKNPWFKNVQRTKRPGHCVSNCHLDPLMGHTI